MDGRIAWMDAVDRIEYGRLDHGSHATAGQRPQLGREYRGQHILVPVRDLVRARQPRDADSCQRECCGEEMGKANVCGFHCVVFLGFGSCLWCRFIVELFIVELSLILGNWSLTVATHSARYGDKENCTRPYVPITAGWGT